MLREHSSSLCLVMFANIPGALARSGGGRSQEGMHRVGQTTALAPSHLLTGYSHLRLSPTHILHSMCLVPSLNGVHSINVGINTQEHCDPAFALPLVSCETGQTAYRFWSSGSADLCFEEIFILYCLHFPHSQLMVL